MPFTIVYDEHFILKKIDNIGLEFNVKYGLYWTDMGKNQIRPQVFK